MARYIDADNLKQVLTELYDSAKWDYRELHFSLFDMVGNIDGETTADAVPVVHARWKFGKCTKCGGDAPFWCMASTYRASSYCPDCGAMMDGDVDG